LAFALVCAVCAACGRETVVGRFLPQGRPAAPVFDPPAGIYLTNISVTISADPGVLVHFTTNGQAPTIADPLYTGPILVSGRLELAALTVTSNDARRAGPVTRASYLVDPEAPQAAAPAFSPPGGTYPGPTNVLITSATPGAVIRYTTNGDLPGAGSPQYLAPVPIITNVTLRAVAYAAGHAASPPAQAVYVISNVLPRAAMPTFNPPEGTFTGATNVAIASVTPGAVIRFTTNGDIPTEASPAYTAPLSVTTNVVLRAVAFADGHLPSETALATYLIMAVGPQPLNVDYMFAMGTGSGIVWSTNSGAFHDIPLPFAVSNVAVDIYGNVYTSFGSKSSPFGIVMNLGASVRINSNYNGHYGASLVADDGGHSFATQYDNGQFYNEGLDYGSGFLTSVSWLKPGTINNNKKICVAVTRSGNVLVVGDEGGYVSTSLDQGASFTQQLAWEGSTPLDRIAVSAAGVVVVAHGNQIRNSQTWGAQTTHTLGGTVSYLGFEGETLYIGMTGGRVAVSADYGATRNEQTGGLSGETVIVCGGVRGGGILAATAAGRVLLTTDIGTAFGQIHAAGTTAYGAAIRR
jgi:hypothetical protein